MDLKGRAFARYLAASVCAAGLLLSGGSFAQTEKPVNFNITATDLANALNQFARQSDRQIVFSSAATAGRRAKPLSGSYRPQEALDALLRDSGLVYDVAQDGTIVVSAGRSNTSTPGGVPAANPIRTAAVETTESRASRSQGTPAGAEEIIVTATKRSEKLREVPMSIAVIGNQEIDRRGLIGMQDYLRSIPGVNQIDQGSISNSIIMRGISTQPASENFYSGPTVATYFDETPITGAGGIGQGGIDVRPVDIERIEVLRGPQGTTFGDASLGGALRLIPVKPTLDRYEAKAAVSYSSTAGLGGDNTMVQGVVNVPIVTDKLAIRAVGYRYDESGYYRNVAGTNPTVLAAAQRFGLTDFVRGFTQDDIGRMRTVGGRLAALWQPTEKLTVAINLLTQKIEQDGRPSTDFGTYDQVRTPIAPRGRLRGAPGEVTDNNIDLASAVFTYDLGWASLTSSLSWIDADSGSTSALPIGFLSFAGLSTTTVASHFRSFTTETRLATQFDGPVQILGGVFYQNVKNGYANTFWYPGTQATNPFQTDPAGLSTITRNLDQRAVFGEISYKLTDSVTATIGGRYFDYEKNERDFQEGGLYGISAGAGVPVQFDDGEGHSNFKASLSFKPTDDTTLYASWAQGFRLGRPTVGVAPGLCDRNNDGVIDGSGVSLASTRRINSDSLDNYEVGAKLLLLDRRLSVDAAAYHITWDGLPIGVRVGSCNASYTANAGAAVSDGLEFQTGYLILDSLKVNFGAGYTSARLSKDAPALNALKSAQLPGTPKFNANLGLQYDFDISGHGAFVRVDSFYTGAYYGDLLKTPSLRSGDYVKVDLRAGVVIHNFDLELFVRNLTDERTFTWRDADNSYRLQPRTLGVQIGYRL
jgi:outer membrane receptor protein involved in Fe transport